MTMSFAAKQIEAERNRIDCFKNNILSGRDTMRV